MSTLLEQQTATELQAMRRRCQRLEETCGQALRLLSVGRLQGQATDDEINAWHRAVTICRAKYALIVAGKEDAHD